MTLRFKHPAQQIVLQDYIHAVEDAKARRDALMAQIEALLPRWSMAPLVEALQDMRGVALIVAVKMVATVLSGSSVSPSLDALAATTT